MKNFQNEPHKTVIYATKQNYDHKIISFYMKNWDISEKTGKVKNIEF